MKVLLIHPPTSSRHPEPPLGIGYLGSVLHQHGVETRILDMEPLGIRFNALPGLIREYSPDLVGISFMTSQYRYGMECFHAARKGSPNALTVAGGVHTSALPREVLLENRDIDFAVVGEGEQTLGRACRMEKYSWTCVSGWGGDRHKPSSPPDCRP
jgi:anaerobic magnesium-protoporphyrin IX monomethyl ester cyclase